MYSYVFGQVFRNVHYVVVALIVALTIVSATLLLPNKALIVQVLFSEYASFGTKISFILNLFSSISTNFTFVSASYLFLVAILFAINISLLIFYIRRRQVVEMGSKAQLTSIGGFVSGILGIGCAACGSVVLTAIFGLLGAGSIIAFLPLNGLEFGILGIALLLFSSHYLIKKINDPLVCSSD